MEQNRYEPIKHNALSRAGHALGEGAQGGFWGGLKTAGLGLLLVPAAAAGIASYMGAAAFGIGVAAIAGLGVAVFAAPALAVIGTAVGVVSGAKHGKDRTGKEQMAARYVDGYEGQMAAMQNELASAMERQAMAQRPIVVQQPVQQVAPSAPAPKIHRAEADVPSTKIDAGALQYDNRVAGPELAMAR